MVKFSKRINTQKKFKNPPSTQVSGMPFKSVSDISRINSVGYNKHGQINPLTARPPAGTGATPTDFPQSNEKAKGAGVVNPFYIWLLDNSFTRMTAPLNETNGTFTTLHVVPTGVNWMITQGEEFYIYHPTTFNSKLFTTSRDFTGVDAQLRVDSIAVQKGVDNFPSGSFIVKKYNVISKQSAVVPVGSGSTTYLAYLPTVNNWYSSSAYSLSLGTAVGSEVDSTAIRASEFVAPSMCSVTHITIAFYVNKTADLEFKICRVPLVNNSTSNVTFAPMTHTDNDDSYTINTNYVKTFTISAGGNLETGQGVAFLCRSTTDSTVRMYGRGFMQII